LLNKTTVKYTALKLGDLLYRTKGFAIQHTGVYLGNQRVLHNRPSDGAITTSLADFGERLMIKVKSTHIGCKQEISDRLTKILAAASRYRLLSNNCESMSHFLITGRKHSPQIRATIVGAMAGGLLGRKFSTQGMLLSTKLGGVTECLLENTT